MKIRTFEPWRLARLINSKQTNKGDHSAQVLCEKLVICWDVRASLCTRSNLLSSENH